MLTFDRIYYGGDYNPEQWPEEIWPEDMRLMREAGVNLVSLAVFGWARLEPQPGQYQFEWLDRILDLLHGNGIQVALATATASPPLWFSRLHPESWPVAEDGLPYKPGSRQFYCPSSIAYREAVSRLAAEMASRYGQHPAVVMWHVNNEYGCHVHDCFCPVCTKAFREWLQERYGSLDALNESWGTAFWSLGISEWADIQLPNRTTSYRNPAQVLDYRRFINHSLLDLFRAEVDAIRSVGAPQPLFTNMVFGLKALDGFEWAKHQDCTAIDMYIDPSTDTDAWKDGALWHNLTRSWGKGKPYLLVEQTTSQVNWRTVNSLKSPGTIRTYGFQAIARGAASVMYFQWRASKSGAEKFHAGMVPHFGVEGSRIFAEVKQMGAEIARLDRLASQQVHAQVGILFSYENVWALEIDSKPAQVDVWSVLRPWHHALVEKNIPLDFVHPNDDFDQYNVLIAPMLYQLTEAQAEKIRSFVHTGGTLLMTYFSGITDLSERIWLGGYPALLQDVLGLRVEEWQPFQPEETNLLIADGAPVVCTHWADLLHTTTAEVIGAYAQDFYAGRPALTRNRYGAGLAYYAGTLPAQDWLRDWIGLICAEQGVETLVEADPDVEAGLRSGVDGADTLVLVNHANRPAQIDLLGKSGRSLLDDRAVPHKLTLAPYDVLVLELDPGLAAR